MCSLVNPILLIFYKVMFEMHKKKSLPSPLSFYDFEHIPLYINLNNPGVSHKQKYLYFLKWFAQFSVETIIPKHVSHIKSVNSSAQT